MASVIRYLINYAKVFDKEKIKCKYWATTQGSVCVPYTFNGLGLIPNRGM